ncbi:MAG: hypothetical protein A3F72_21430 [Bacteroidetes bacterium RIFCSPLOWO2_12_FULL_35_15]|nr:MAG: hypothetical protein A3F72_21430 [Bacteroidetes bacterium RIFCSPLOWO2_12_FULL_35_15]
MKLQKKNTQFLLIYLPIILIICSFIFYILLSLQINHLHDKLLLLKQENILKLLDEHKREIELHSGAKGEYTVTEINTPTSKKYNVITDTSIFYASQNKFLPFKMLTERFRHLGKDYEITTYSSSIETTHLMVAVFSIHGLIYIIMLFSIVIINRKVSEELWQPFYETIDKLNTYDISMNSSLNLNHETGVTEFDELNRVAQQLVTKDQLAYQSQKQFVENASHEIQTPLAIIRSKAELLMEQPDLNEKTAELINDIAEATTRLSILNKTLLLLAKIENNQFLDQKKIYLSEVIETSLTNFQQSFDDRLPQIKKDLDNSSYITANLSLIEILLNNLIKNAIIHNEPFGNINIALKHNNFIIENTGPALTISEELLFERFRKDSNKPNQTGLGLAIVKQICTLYDYKLSYTYKDHIHRLQVNF